VVQQVLFDKTGPAAVYHETGLRYIPTTSFALCFVSWLLAREGCACVCIWVQTNPCCVQRPGMLVSFFAFSKYWDTIFKVETCLNGTYFLQGNIFYDSNKYMNLYMG
jgi:hypothetical protein